MNRVLFGVCFVIAMPVLAQSVEIITEFNGLDIEWEPLGVEEASSEQVDLKGTPAVTVINRSNERVLCEFAALPDETERTPTSVLEPNDRAVLEVPGKYSEGGPIALLECVKD
ncbi:hypothetical protein SAMN05216421_0617 [Halopseudomonas xinjiangensis]|uniref:Uncharacterized protein n=1 Tax=Halopseudomonas xinjiangensis TaxID=487184 RepID=A0A1H1N674_9GAMM|nr:hypothetical protein [Halopseudomonas xinjiangensis]SDR94502.1 hypothetical protein SAMN05216421_0617 [Halopseudomonas xinjiangensis]